METGVTLTNLIHGIIGVAVLARCALSQAALAGVHCYASAFVVVVLIIAC